MFARRPFHQDSDYAARDRALAALKAAPRPGLRRQFTAEVVAQAAAAAFPSVVVNERPPTSWRVDGRRRSFVSEQGDQGRTVLPHVRPGSAGERDELAFAASASGGSGAMSLLAHLRANADIPLPRQELEASNPDAELEFSEAGLWEQVSKLSHMAKRSIYTNKELRDESVQERASATRRRVELQMLGKAMDLKSNELRARVHRYTLEGVGGENDEELAEIDPDLISGISSSSSSSSEDEAPRETRSVEDTSRSRKASLTSEPDTATQNQGISASDVEIPLTAAAQNWRNLAELLADGKPSIEDIVARLKTSERSTSLEALAAWLLERLPLAKSDLEFLERYEDERLDEIGKNAAEAAFGALERGATWKLKSGDARTTLGMSTLAERLRHWLQNPLLPPEVPHADASGARSATPKAMRSSLKHHAHPSPTRRQSVHFGASQDRRASRRSISHALGQEPEDIKLLMAMDDLAKLEEELEEINDYDAGNLFVDPNLEVQPGLSKEITETRQLDHDLEKMRRKERARAAEVDHLNELIAANSSLNDALSNVFRLVKATGLAGAKSFPMIHTAELQLMSQLPDDEQRTMYEGLKQEALEELQADDEAQKRVRDMESMLQERLERNQEMLQDAERKAHALEEEIGGARDASAGEPPKAWIEESRSEALREELAELREEVSRKRATAREWASRCEAREAVLYRLEAAKQDVSSKIEEVRKQFLREVSKDAEDKKPALSPKTAQAALFSRSGSTRAMDTPHSPKHGATLGTPKSHDARSASKRSMSKRSMSKQVTDKQVADTADIVSAEGLPWHTSVTPTPLEKWRERSKTGCDEARLVPILFTKLLFPEARSKIAGKPADEYLSALHHSNVKLWERLQRLEQRLGAGQESEGESATTFLDLGRNVRRPLRNATGEEEAEGLPKSLLVMPGQS